MQRLVLEYFDQNEEFGALLPRRGVIEKTIHSSTGIKWAVFRLDHPLEHWSVRHESLLLRSRWEGHSLAMPGDTSVFILLCPERENLADGFVASADHLVAWGFVRTETPSMPQSP